MGSFTVISHLIKRRQDLLLPIVGILAAGFSVLAFYASRNPYFPIDLATTRVIQGLRIGWFDILMRFLTLIGSGLFQVLLPLLAAGLLLYLKRRLDSYLLMISTVGTVAVSEVFKKLVARPRPDSPLVFQSDQFNGADSFPSGHVLFFVGFFGFIAYLAVTRLRPGFIRNTILLVCLAAVGLISLSRIYLGAHWLSDTLGSYLIGFAWLGLMILFARKLSA